MFLRILIAAWILFLFCLVLLFLFPDLNNLVRGDDRPLGYTLMVLGLFTLGHVTTRLYRPGMRIARRPQQAEKGHDYANQPP